MVEDKKQKDEEIVLSLSPKATEQLKVLQYDLNATSGAQVVEASLALMRTLNTEIKGGSEIIINNPNKKTKRLLFQ